jgi:hypothetical protein
VNADRDRLERQFEEHIRQLIERSITECNYPPHAFIGMIGRHKVRGACRLVIMDRKTPTGFTTLWEKQRLDLTVEAAVLQSPWCKLFDVNVLMKARKRLADYKYTGDVSCPCLDDPTNA